MKGDTMSEHFEDGIKVVKLHDKHPVHELDAEQRAILAIWRQMNGAPDLENAAADKPQG